MDFEYEILGMMSFYNAKCTPYLSGNLANTNMFEPLTITATTLYIIA